MNYLTVEDIAETAYEVNRAYCAVLGDLSFGPWNEAPAWQKETCVNGVLFHLHNQEATPAASHESWLDEKVNTGWKWGAVKDPEKKEHPCMVPFENLPQEQQMKDHIFRAVCRSLIPVLGE